MRLPLQIVLYFSGCALLTGAFSAFWTGNAIHGYLAESQFQQGKLLSQVMAKSIAKDTVNGDINSVHDTLRNMVDKHDIVHYAYITDSNEHIYAHTFEKNFPEQLAARIHGEQHLILAPHGTKIMQVSSLIPGINARLYVGLNQANILNFIKNIKIEIIKISAMVSVFGIAVVYFFCIRVCRPLEALTNHIRAYGRGELKEKVTVDNKTPEVGHLAEVFNHMIDRRREVEDLSLRFGRIMDQSFNEIFLFDSKTLYFTQINSGACKNLGYSPEEIVHMTPLGIKPSYSLEQFEELVAPLRTREKPEVIFETIHQRKDNTLYNVEIRLQLMHDENPPVFVAVVQDTTERKKIEKNLMSAKVEAEEANQAKSVFLSNMSHEIRTPLNAINGYSQILLRNDTLDEDTREAIKTMDRSGKNLLMLINDILDLSKIEAGKSELHCTNFNLSDLTTNLKNMFELRCDQKKLDWDVKELSSPTWVYGDDVKLQQILTNLIGNATKFTKSGKVSFTVRSLDKNQFRFSILDTGPGIERDQHGKIFEAFGQEKLSSKKGGTGLGLSISKRMVELMGSELILESEPGKGSHFYFTLVLPRGERLEAPTSFSNSKILFLAPGQEVRALIVDDVKENRDVVSGLLRDIGVTVFEAENGKEGVEAARKLLPDIIFMDMRMPLMNGEQATKLIQDELGRDKSKIVAITASALDHKREYYLSLGFDDYMSKPFREENLFQCLGTLLDVKFIFDEEEKSPVTLQQISNSDFSQFSILERLHDKMSQAANNYNITNLEDHLKELNPMDENSLKLAEYLKQMLKNYDMEGISRALEKVQKTKAP